jgi:DNA-nicking Smr family endonuclease
MRAHGDATERNMTSSTWFERLRDTLREFLGVAPTLDLHGLGVREAVDEAARFLRQAQAHDARVVRIVYGKGHGSPGGKGVLRDVIPRWLEREGAELVERYQRVPDASGADGAVRVWVRKRGA